MHNTQAKEPIVQDTVEGALDIVNIWETIQGEGPFAGTPAVFIRLAGCNLTCPLCDTDYTSNRRVIAASDILQEVRKLRNAYEFGRRSLVVLTGGEPFRQPIWMLCHKLLTDGYAVQVETNGTLFPSSIPWYRGAGVTVVCSPKTPKINDELKPHIKSLKYVISADNVSRADGLPTKVLGLPCEVARPWEGFGGDIFVQPEDHADPLENHRNTQAAVDSCLTFGYRLCLQTHKIVGLP